MIDLIVESIKHEGKMISELVNFLDFDTIIKISSLLNNCSGKIVLSGCGTSAMAAKKITHSLNCIECPAIFITPSDANHGGLGVLKSNDIMILISKGGATSELLNLAKVCKIKKTPLVVVSENDISEIVQLSDVFLKIKVQAESCKYNLLATASTLAVIATFDAICILIMDLKNYSKDEFSIIHSGGAVGEKLRDGCSKPYK